MKLTTIKAQYTKNQKGFIVTLDDTRNAEYNQKHTCDSLRVGRAVRLKLFDNLLLVKEQLLTSSPKRQEELRARFEDAKLKLLVSQNCFFEI